ncbi:FMN-binding negative transcriptional regulator [Lewinella cohaerens]|uniref:FMN-binding negative transcriptional regulator n=1 Tax=Lewinella cohaerens TaxID=70995 RepID=UPI00037E41D7|nr:FMN-binding negative transcriptional regulator [Lewinella cohaerens]
MYIPSHYNVDDQEEILSFLHAYSFAAIVNQEGKRPVATHLPFVVRQVDDKLLLEAHFARANPQWKLLEDGQEALVIFAEPHAYISPRHYDKAQNVPTWNYQAVHVYGKARLLTNEAEAFAHLERLIATFEQDYQAQWADLSDGYKQAMLSGIVAFELEVAEVQAKAKLSQNKTTSEQERIAAELSQSTDSVIRDLGEAMVRNIGKGEVV